jgi:hypothetical protein
MVCILWQIVMSCLSTCVQFKSYKPLTKYYLNQWYRDIVSMLEPHGHCGIVASIGIPYAGRYGSLLGQSH